MRFLKASNTLNENLSENSFSYGRNVNHGLYTSLTASVIFVRNVSQDLIRYDFTHCEEFVLCCLSRKKFSTSKPVQTRQVKRKNKKKVKRLAFQMNKSNKFLLTYNYFSFKQKC